MQKSESRFVEYKKTHTAAHSASPSTMEHTFILPLYFGEFVKKYISRIY